VLGGAFGAAFVIGVKELVNRQLSSRQEIRVAASASYVYTDVQERLQQGDQVRHDFFFNNGGRSSAQELFEGILLICKDQYQEKKIYYTSKIFEKTAFDDAITPEIANQVLIAAEGFTYRKLCVIAFFARKAKFDATLLMKDPYSLYDDSIFGVNLESLIQDVYDLSRLGIIDTATNALLSRHDIIPYQFTLTVLGQLHFNLLQLSKIPKRELQPIYNELVYKDEYGDVNAGI
jgi:hypothetical protein